MWVCCPKHNGRRRHGRRRFSGDFGAWVLLIHLVSTPGSRHILRPLPTEVVGVAITDLQNIITSFTFVPPNYHENYE